MGRIAYNGITSMVDNNLSARPGKRWRCERPQQWCFTRRRDFVHDGNDARCTHRSGCIYDRLAHNRCQIEGFWMQLICELARNRAVDKLLKTCGVRSRYGKIIGEDSFT